MRTAYVGMGRHGFAPNFTAAVKSGTLDDVEYSEWTMLQGIRAAADGLPFLPTRAGEHSDVVDALGLAAVVDPYTGVNYLAVPPLRLDVAVIHAWRAPQDGDVQFAWPPEHLWDVDVLAARAARYVIVTVEEIVGAAEIAARSELTRLFGFEVDMLVHAPGGVVADGVPAGLGRRPTPRPSSTYARSGSPPVGAPSVALEAAPGTVADVMAARSPARSTTVTCSASDWARRWR